jgi:hypothetical protein
MSQELFTAVALIFVGLVVLGLGLGSLPFWAWLQSRSPKLYRVQGSLRRDYRLHNSGSQTVQYEFDAEVEQLPGRRS